MGAHEILVGAFWMTEQQLDLFGYQEYWDSLPDWWMCGEHWLLTGTPFGCMDDK